LLALLTHNPWFAVPSLCIASFLKDFAMAASWSTCIDIGHRYSGTVAGFMNMVGNLGTFVSPPIVAYLATTTARQDAPLQLTSAAGLLAAPAGDGVLQATSMVAATATTDWHLALVYSACMFFVAAAGWLFINPRRVIVYAREDRQRLRAEGLLD